MTARRVAHHYADELRPAFRQATPEQPYSITWQVLRDIALATIAFACLAVALVCWLAGAR